MKPKCHFFLFRFWQKHCLYFSTNKSWIIFITSRKQFLISTQATADFSMLAGFRWLLTLAIQHLFSYFLSNNFTYFYIFFQKSEIAVSYFFPDNRCFFFAEATVPFFLYLFLNNTCSLFLSKKHLSFYFFQTKAVQYSYP